MNISIDTDFLSQENGLADNKNAIKVIHSYVFDVMLGESRGFVGNSGSLQQRELYHINIKFVMKIDHDRR